MTVFWIALALALALPLAGAAFVLARGITLYRTARGTSARLGTELAKIDRASADIDVNMRLGAEAGTRLREASARLARSRAQLDVQLAAVREARESVGLLSLLTK